MAFFALLLTIFFPQFVSPADTTEDAVIVLEDGRRLGYAEYGDPQGMPVFYFHGGQESRLSARFMDGTAAALGLRIIVPDRPGIGLSDFLEDRTLLDWPTDVAALADHLGIEQFSVFGLSGGGPHVLACAYAIPDRLHRVAVVSGASPKVGGTQRGMWMPGRLIYWMASLPTDFLLRRTLRKEFKTLRDKPGERMRQMREQLPEPDKALFRSKPAVLPAFVEASLESFRNGTDGVVQEWKLYVRPWGFRPGDITVHVDLWYGLEDQQVPPVMGRYLNHKLPSSTLHRVEDAAHFSLIHNHLDEILGSLR